MICKNCKTELEEEEGMRFCPKCGCPIEEPANDTINKSAEQESETHRKQIPGIIIAIICLVVVISIILTIVFIKSRISKGAESSSDNEVEGIVEETKCEHSLDERGYCQICGEDVGIIIEREEVEKYFDVEVTDNTDLEVNWNDTYSGFVEIRIRPKDEYKDCSFEQCYVGLYATTNDGKTMTSEGKLDWTVLNEKGEGTISQYVDWIRKFTGCKLCNDGSTGPARIHYPSPAAQNTGSSKSSNEDESDSATFDKGETNGTDITDDSSSEGDDDIYETIVS